MFTKKGDEAVLAKIADAPEPYREIGERLHQIIRESAPSLEPIVRWGLPFYVKDGQDVCYIKIDKDFIAFGFGEVKNPTREEGAHHSAHEHLEYNLRRDDGFAFTTFIQPGTTWSP